MAIQPIDLSTMYSQMDNVARMSSGQEHSASVANFARLERSQQQELQKSENVNQVNKKNGEGSKVKSDGKNSSQGQEEASEKKKKDAGEEEKEPDRTIHLTDPRRGRLIDITG
ncbi:hypothetical protein [Treponema sp.]|uniref:hypothetical protein n=1 Tax=Treponema sp. TaxID=166 RepID=UPI0025DBB052|nr:hypothetical protein [Treponema sp.]MCR5217233.1 hypothetical protein [Treponema sp.]